MPPHVNEIRLIPGIPGVEMTTVTSQFATSFESGVYVTDDNLCEMIVSGQSDPDGTVKYDPR